MRKLLLCLLLVPGFVLACNQSIKVKQNTVGFIYLEYSKFQNLNEPSGIQYANIKPIICTFSTHYKGKINFQYATTTEGTTTTISNTSPLTHTFIKSIIYNIDRVQINIRNYGCNTGFDGDKCMQAKQQRLDDLIINCN